MQMLEVSLDNRDAEELVSVLNGYYKLLTENTLHITINIEPSPIEEMGMSFRDLRCDIFFIIFYYLGRTFHTSSISFTSFGPTRSVELCQFR